MSYKKDISDPFWGEKFDILYKTDRLIEFFPAADQSLSERMNSLTRLIIYVSVILSIYQKKSTAIHFGMILLGLIYLMWKNQTIVNVSNALDGNLTENFDDHMKTQNQTAEISPDIPPCQMPTEQNPFMNYLQGDHPNRGAACQGPGIQQQAANLLDRQLFSDVDDLYSRNNNSRLFMTMPGTTRVPDRTDFANWLIKGDGSNKEDGLMPAPHEDPRRDNKQLIPEDLDREFDVAGFTME